jgi:hypothetical protein
MAGTYVASGSAVGIAIATGDRTVFGRVRSCSVGLSYFCANKVADCETDQCTKERPDTAPERDAVFCRLDCWHYAGHDCGCHHHLVSLASHIVRPIAPCAEHLVKGGLVTTSSPELDYCSCPDRGLRQCRSRVYSRRPPYRSHC